MPKRYQSEIAWTKCTGEAHKNPFIDHCYDCMPYWIWIPTCPECGLKLVTTARRNLRCRTCRITFYGWKDGEHIYLPPYPISE